MVLVIVHAPHAPSQHMHARVRVHVSMTPTPRHGIDS